MNIDVNIIFIVPVTRIVCAIHGLIPLYFIIYETNIRCRLFSIINFYNP